MYYAEIVSFCPPRRGATTGCGNIRENRVDVEIRRWFGVVSRRESSKTLDMVTARYPTLRLDDLVHPFTMQQDITRVGRHGHRAVLCILYVSLPNANASIET